MAIGAGGRKPMTVACTPGVRGELRSGPLALCSLPWAPATDYVSPVVTRLHHGRRRLIAAGQLSPNFGTVAVQGIAWVRVAAWANSVGHADPAAVGLALGTVAVMVRLRRIHPLIPGAPIALVAPATAL